MRRVNARHRSSVSATVDPPPTSGLAGPKLAALLVAAFVIHLASSGLALRAAESTPTPVGWTAAGCAVHLLITWFVCRLAGAIVCRREHALDGRLAHELADTRAARLNHHRHRFSPSRQLMSSIEQAVVAVELERLAQRVDDAAEALRLSRLSWRRFRVSRLIAATLGVWGMTFLCLTGWAAASSDAGAAARLACAPIVLATALASWSWLTGLHQNAARFPALPSRAFPLVDDAPPPGAGKVASPIFLALGGAALVLFIVAYREEQTADVLQASGMSVQLLTGLLGFAGIFIAHPLARIDRFWQRSGLSRRQARAQRAFRAQAPKLIRGAGVLCFLTWTTWWTSIALSAAGALPESDVRDTFTGIACALVTLVFAWTGVVGRDWRALDASAGTLTADELYVRLQDGPGRRVALTLLAGGFVVGSVLQLVGTLIG